MSSITVLAENKDNSAVRAVLDLPAFDGKIKDFLKELGASSESEISIRYAGIKDLWPMNSILADNVFFEGTNLQELNLLSYVLERMDDDHFAKYDDALRDCVNDCNLRSAVNKAYDVIAQAAGCEESLTYYNGDNIAEVIRAERILRNPYPEMNKDVFWQIIDTAREKAGRWQDMIEPLVDDLSKLEEPDLVRFNQIYDEYKKLAYKEKLWAAAAVMFGGCSDDGFIGFRAWLITQGKEAYINALADPDSLADLEEVQAFGHEVRSLEYMPSDGYDEGASFEEMTYAASYAYEKKFGKDADIYEVIEKSPLSIQEKAEIAGEITYAADIDTKWTGHGRPWPETLDTLKKLCPKLHNLFYEDEAAEVAIPKKSAEKESVIDKIRQSKQKTEPEKQKNKKQRKDGPEL